MTHKLIQTENYLLVVDDSEIKEGDYHLAMRIVKENGDKAIAFTDKEQMDAIKEIGGAKKIIAHLPLNGALVLEGVDLLPPLEDEVEKLEMEYFIELEKRREVAKNFTGQVAGRHPDAFGHSEMMHMNRGYIEGYNKAKEKYKYTEEDLKEAYDRGLNNVDFDGNTIENPSDDINYFIESLQQPKNPIGFECEVETHYKPKSNVNDLPYMDKPKTTTNSQGLTQWVGKYVY